MPLPPIPSEPPPIAGVHRSVAAARGISFHVTEAGAGRPVLALHGWPSHHYCYRDLLADPPDGLRIIAPDLPGYGWSGPPPHAWAKEDVATDVLALADALGLQRMLLVGHDWGAWIGYLLLLRAPERFDAALLLSVPHIWNGPRQLAPHLWRLAHMPTMAAFGVPLLTRTPFVEQLIYRFGAADRAALPAEEVRRYSARFRDPVCARVSRDTYRTFVTREIPAAARAPERRSATVPIRALLGLGDFAIHRALLSPATALADDYAAEFVDHCGHFLPDERPDVVRERLVALASG